MNHPVRQRILIVSAERAAMKYYRVALEQANYEVEHYSDGWRAFDRFPEDYFVLVILDLLMPPLPEGVVDRNVTRKASRMRNAPLFHEYGSPKAGFLLLDHLRERLVDAPVILFSFIPGLEQLALPDPRTTIENPRTTGPQDLVRLVEERLARPPAIDIQFLNFEIEELDFEIEEWDTDDIDEDVIDLGHIDLNYSLVSDLNYSRLWLEKSGPSKTRPKGP